jgi:hypothetical protein
MENSQTRNGEDLGVNAITPKPLRKAGLKSTQRERRKNGH